MLKERTGVRPAASSGRCGGLVLATILAMPASRHWPVPPPRRRPTLACFGRLLAAALCGIATAGSALAWSLGPDLRQIALRDSNEQVLRLADIRAPLVVMTMAYTACRKFCGTTTLVLEEIQRRLDLLKIEAEVLVLSYDPANDSPAEWRDFRARRALNRSNWHFLSADPGSTRLFARNLDLDFWTYHDHIVHDFRILLLDARWQVVGQVHWADTHKLDAVLAALPAGLRSPPR